MHSFALLALALASSTLARPVEVVDAVVGTLAPVDVKAANVKADYVNVLNDDLNNNHVLRRGYYYEDPAALADVAAAVAAPVEANVANVGLKNVNALNGVANNNKIGKREGSLVDADALAVAPVDAAVANVGLKNVNVANGVGNNNDILKRGYNTLPSVVSNAQSDVEALVKEIRDLLAASSVDSYTLKSDLEKLNEVLAAALKELDALAGLAVDAVLGDEHAYGTLEEVAEAVECLLHTVAELLDEVKKAVSYDLAEVYDLIGCTIHDILKEVVYLVPGLAALLHDILATVVDLLRAVGYLLDLAAIGI